MSKYEIELRGKLNKRQKDKLLKMLKEKGKFIRNYKRIHYCFTKAYKNALDLRIRITNNLPEFHLKIGQIQKANRKEIAIPFNKDKLAQSFEFLKLLGHDKGVKAIRNAQVYKYLGIEWAIVEVPNHSWYFEAEKLVRNKEDGKQAEKEIQKICQNLGLVTMAENETIDYIKTLDREANELFEIK